jgi:hypothetical protein
MYVISLIFYAFIIIYVFSVSLRYYYSRHALKKRNQRIQKGKTPIRTANASEIVGLRWMFGVQVPSNTEVYKTEGTVEYLSLKGRYSEYREFWVNGIQIQCRRSTRKSQDDKLVEKILEEKESLACEYIIDSRGKAYPVNIDSKSISTNFTNNSSLFDQEVPRWRLRDATSRERQTLIKKVRWSSILLLLPTAPLFGISILMEKTEDHKNAIILLTAGAVLMILSFLIQAWRVPSKEGDGEICSVKGRWEQIKSRNPIACQYGLKGTDIRLSLSLAARKYQPEELLRREIDIYFKKHPLTGRVSCKLVRADTYSLDQRLRSRIIKAPRCWRPFSLILIISGLSIFLTVMHDKSWNLLTAIPENLKNGPRILRTAEDTQMIKEGEIIRFEELLVQPVEIIVSKGFLPIESPLDLIKNPDPFEKELTESLKQHWTDFSVSMNKMFRHADGRRLGLDEEDFYFMDSKAVVCTNPNELIQYLSRDHRYNASMPLGDAIVNPAYSGARINWLVQNLAINVKTGIYNEARNSWKELQHNHSIEKLKSHPYPLFIYADFPLPEQLSMDREVEKEELLYLLPIDELIKKAYQTVNVASIEGEYYLYSPQNYTAPWYNLEGFRPLGFVEIEEYTFFLHSILISMGYIIAGLLFFVGVMTALLRE